LQKFLHFQNSISAAIWPPSQESPVLKASSLKTGNGSIDGEEECKVAAVPWLRTYLSGWASSRTGAGNYTLEVRSPQSLLPVLLSCCLRLSSHGRYINKLMVPAVPVSPPTPGPARRTHPSHLSSPPLLQQQQLKTTYYNNH
jgi:hypothetical protein